MSRSPDSSFSPPPLDVLSNTASSNSTPPTTVADSDSLHSDTSKHDVITVAIDSDSPPAAEQTDAVDEHAPPEHEQILQQDEPQQRLDTPGRARRARGPPPVYNLAKLVGTDGHGKRRAKGDIVSNRRRRTIGRATVIDQESHADESSDPKSPKAARATIDALNLQSPRRSGSRPTRRQSDGSPRSLRSSSRRAASPSSKASPAGVRTRRSAGKVENTKVPLELRRLQDTKEFAHSDEKPVIYTVWSNGKYVDPNEPQEPPARKKAKVATDDEQPEKEEESPEPITNTKTRRVKKYLDKGLYAGQDPPADITKGLTVAEKKKLAEMPELLPSGRVNTTMPSPMFTGLRMLIAGRDFKLPYNVCNPLPPGQPKPDEWKKMTKNRFIGDSKEIWRKSDLFQDMTRCECKPVDGCGESCLNRSMFYECDDKNCNIGRGHCTNRAFADLMARRAKGGKYHVGVEVIKTPDRGYGVRSNRCFKPHQIIMEYAGEIITEEECERRMNEVYKDNECYYLMSFEQNMIIDATTGSIARFVNHSCNPNCKMVKWVVAGQPRMALFAGDKPIMTGDELTYDYNFDPFSAKNVQGCLCGEPNCRGILGPRTREQKAKPELQKTVKNAVKAGKRKLQEMMGSERTSSNKPKRPRITSTKEALATVGLQMAKGTATAIKKTASSVASNAKKAVRGSKTPAQRRSNASTVLKKTATTSRVVKAYGKKGTTKKQVSSRSTSTVTAKGKGVKAVKKTTVKKTTAKGTTTKTKTTATKSLGVAKVTKARGPKPPIAPARMTAAEKKRKEELDRQYEITVAHPD